MRRAKHETSSDDMIDIQIEESLVRETLMSIDSANFYDDMLTLGLFFLVLVLITITGIFGPPAVLSEEIASNITGSRMQRSIKDNISPAYRFLDFSFYLMSSENVTSFNESKISFTYTGATSDNSRKTDSKHDVPITLLPNNSTRTKRIRVFRDIVLTYTNISLDLVFKSDIPKCFNQIVSTFRTGNPDHTLTQIFFRTIFLIFDLLFFIILVRKLRSMQMKYWHLEQKLTVPFMFLSVLHNNPLYIYQVYYPSQVLIVFETLMTNIFVAYFRFFVLVLFDSLRYKNRKTSSCFFVPKIIIVLLLFISSVTHGIYDDISAFKGNLIGADNIEVIFRFTEIGLFALYLILAIVAIIRAGVKVDITERYKFNMYVASGGTALFLLAIVEIVFRAFDLFKNSSIHFVVNMSVENAFVLLMAYFHWPYEVLDDQTYRNDANNRNNVISSNEFFVNNEAPEGGN